MIRYGKGSSLKTTKILLILALVGAVAGCPKRQTSLRLAYAPAPPAPAPTSPVSPPQVLIIENPPPPKPAESSPASAPVESAAHAPTPHHSRRAARSRKPEPPPEPAQTTVAEAPQLEPFRSPQQQTALEQHINALKAAVEGRIRHLSHSNLSAADRKTLQDAHTFLSQTDQAMKQGDLQESMNLAQKADLLVAAVEQRH